MLLLLCTQLVIQAVGSHSDYLEAAFNLHSNLRSQPGRLNWQSYFTIPNFILHARFGTWGCSWLM